MFLDDRASLFGGRPSVSALVVGLLRFRFGRSADTISRWTPDAGLTDATSINFLQFQFLNISSFDAMMEIRRRRGIE